ncbi:hypothetical protein WA158_003273 [Blastocystis sp. Blastoise]
MFTVVNEVMPFNNGFGYLLDYYSCYPPTTVTCLHCLLMMTSMRRYLFVKPESRLEFLKLLIEEANFQLSELFRTPRYSEFIRLLTNFTIDSFKNWQWCNIDNTSCFNESVHQLIQAYINGKMESVDDYVDDDMNNPLSDTESLAIEMQQLPQIVRYFFKCKKSNILNHLIDVILNNLRYWEDNTVIIKNCLDIFLNLCNDHACSQLLLDISTTQYPLETYTCLIGTNYNNNILSYNNDKNYINVITKKNNMNDEINFFGDNNSIITSL